MRGADRWADLQVKLFAAFVAVVDERSFTAAGRALGYSQSAVSQQIAVLERTVGAQLVVRRIGSRAPVRLTPAGERFLEHARAVLAQLERAHAELAEVREQASRHVAVAAIPSMAVQLLPAIRRDVEHQLGLRVSILEARGQESLFALLDDGRADVAFGVLPVPGRFVAAELGVDPYVAVLPAHSRFARGGPVALSSLRERRLLGARLGAHEEAVVSHLHAAGIDPGRIERHDDNRLVQSLAASGSGIALVPALTVDRADPAVRVAPLEPPLPPRRLAVLRRRDAELSAAAGHLWDVAVSRGRRLLAA